MAEKPRDEFLPTLGKCLLGMVIAIALGCFIGYGLLIMIGILMATGTLGRLLTLLS